MQEENDSIINFAICGYGRIGQRHASVVKEHPFANLVGIIDEKEVKDSSDFHYYTLEDFFEKSSQKVDVINITSPNWLHAEHSIAALKAGCHVIIEKPMALRKSDAEKILSQALQSNKQVFVVMQNRFSPVALWLKSVVEKNLLGELYQIQVNCFWNRDHRYYKSDGWQGDKLKDGGTLYTQFSHFVDLIYWLFGDIHIQNAVIRNQSHQYLKDFDDNGIVTFSFENEKGIGSLCYSTSVANQNLESSITIIAQNGSIKIGGQYLEEITYCDVKNLEIPVLNNSLKSGHYLMLDNAISVINRKASIHTNAFEGLKVVDIIERIYNF